MVLLNMMIGTMELLIGVIVLIAVIAMEVLFISKRLSKKWIDISILKIIILSNIVSTLVGLICLSWVWNTIVKGVKSILNLSEDYTSKYFGIGFLIVALLLTLLIETPFNLMNLKTYNNRAIIISTLYANVLTYVLIGLLTLMSLV